MNLNQIVMPIKTEMKDVDPGWAGEIMNKHYKLLEEGKFRQRPMSLAVVRKYAAEMKAGAWKETPEAITFDDVGNLLNGQHRLEAVRMARKTIRMMVSTGWPQQTNGVVGLIDVVDTGRSRSVGQLLSLHGSGSANNVAATVRTIARVGLGGIRPIMSYSSTVFILDQLGARLWIDKVMSQTQSHRDFIARTVGPIAYYYSARPNKALQFADAIFNFKTGSPAVRLFLKWAKNNVGREQDQYVKTLAAAIMAFDVLADEKTIKLRPKREPVEWLSNINPTLREEIHRVVPPAQVKV